MATPNKLLLDELLQLIESTFGDDGACYELGKFIASHADERCTMMLILSFLICTLKRMDDNSAIVRPPAWCFARHYEDDNISKTLESLVDRINHLRSYQPTTIHDLENLSTIRTVLDVCRQVVKTILKQ